MATMHYQTGTGTGSSASASTHPSFVSGDIIETDYYDTSMINGSGSRVRYTGSTITANSTHWPDSDGYFYDGGGKQFKLIGPFNVLMFGAKGDNTNDDAPAINAATPAVTAVSSSKISATLLKTANAMPVQPSAACLAMIRCWACRISTTATP